MKPRTFRERTLTPRQWMMHAVLCFTPRPILMRKDDRVVGVLLPAPLRHFGKLWTEWRIVRWG